MKKLTREVIEEIFRTTGNTVGFDARKQFIKELERRGFLEGKRLTFEKIRKECVSGESILIDTEGYGFSYIGFFKEKLLLGNFGRVCEFREDDIYDWRIKE